MDDVAGNICRYCSPRHKMLFQPRNEGSHALDDVVTSTMRDQMRWMTWQVTSAMRVHMRWMTWRVTSARLYRLGVPVARQPHECALHPVRRGLHSFPFQLNLSSSVHRVTQLNS